MDLFCHAPSDLAALDDLPTLYSVRRSDTAILLPYVTSDPHLAAMVRVSPSRFSRGDLVWGFYDADRLIHVAWTRYDHWLDLTYELGPDARWPLPEESVVIYDCYTLLAARGHGYYPRALATLVKYAPALTYWIYTVRTNLASRRGIARAGFVPHESYCRWRWPLGERLGLWHHGV